jgi:LPXTG-motif cell wall-anchored protein
LDAIIANIDSLYAVIGLAILVFGGLIIDKRRRDERATQPEVLPVVNGPGAAMHNGGTGARAMTVTDVKLLIAEHVEGCPRMNRVDQKLDRMGEKLEAMAATLNVIKGKME